MFVKDRVRKEEKGVRGVLYVGEKSYWLREQIQLLKHHSCAAIRTELPCLADHPRSSSPRHHQPSLCFYATLPFTDLIFFLYCCRCFLRVWWICSEWLSHRIGRLWSVCVCVCGKALVYTCGWKGKHRYLSANVCTYSHILHCGCIYIHYSVWILYVYSYTIMSVCGCMRGRRQWCLRRL